MDMSIPHSLIACHDCDLLYRKHPLQDGERATCFRCGAVLYHKKPDTLNRTLIHSLTNLILFVLANVFPFMSFQLQGREQVTLLASGGMELYYQGFWELSLLVIAVGVLFPLLQILGTLYVLIPLKFNRRVWKAKEIFRFVETLTPWAMMEVFMLGVIVGYVKLIDLATIVLGISLYAFAVLIVLMAITAAALDPEEVWDRLDRAQ
jgi:paraquat-inducible protein A